MPRTRPILDQNPLTPRPHGHRQRSHVQTGRQLHKKREPEIRHQVHHHPRRVTTRGAPATTPTLHHAAPGLRRNRPPLERQRRPRGRPLLRFRARHPPLPARTSSLPRAPGRGRRTRGDGPHRCGHGWSLSRRVPAGWQQPHLYSAFQLHGARAAGAARVPVPGDAERDRARGVAAAASTSRHGALGVVGVPWFGSSAPNLARLFHFRGPSAAAFRSVPLRY